MVSGVPGSCTIERMVLVVGLVQVSSYQGRLTTGLVVSWMSPRLSLALGNDPSSECTFTYLASTWYWSLKTIRLGFVQPVLSRAETNSSLNFMPGKPKYPNQVEGFASYESVLLLSSTWVRVLR